MKDQFYTQKEVMEMLNVSESTLRRWRNNKVIPKPKKLGRRIVGWKIDEFEKWFLTV